MHKISDLEIPDQLNLDTGWSISETAFGRITTTLLEMSPVVKNSLMKNTSYTLSEIAYLCGFASLSTFSKVFKEKYGVSPTTYEKKYQQEQILQVRTNFQA